MYSNFKYQKKESPYTGNVGNVGNMGDVSNMGNAGNKGEAPVVNYPMQERLEDMYPEIYYRVLPKVHQMCNMKDTADNPEMYPYPSRDAVERMTDDIYRETMMEMGDPEDGQIMPSQQRQPIFGGYGFPGGYPWYGGFPGGYPFPGYGYPPGYGFGGRRIIRDLVGVLLIRELLRRRGQLY